LVRRSLANTTEAEGVSKVLGSAPICPPHDPRFLIGLPQTRPTTKRAHPHVLVDKFAVNCRFHKSSPSCDRSALSVPTRSQHRFAIVHGELVNSSLLSNGWSAATTRATYISSFSPWIPNGTRSVLSCVFPTCCDAAGLPRRGTRATPIRSRFHPSHIAKHDADRESVP
jgi:hypothetical protein